MYRSTPGTARQDSLYILRIQDLAPGFVKHKAIPASGIVASKAHGGDSWCFSLCVEIMNGDGIEVRENHEKRRK